MTNLTKAIELIKNNRYSVSYMDGSYDAQYSGTKIFQTLSQAEKDFETISLDTTGNWSRYGYGQPRIFKEICVVNFVSKKSLESLQELLDEESIDSNYISKELTDIHDKYAEPIEREEYIWENSWNEETRKTDGEYILTHCKRDFSTIPFSESGIDLDSLKEHIITGSIE